MNLIILVSLLDVSWVHPEPAAIAGSDGHILMVLCVSFETTFLQKLQTAFWTSIFGMRFKVRP